MQWNIRPNETKNSFLIDSDRPLPWIFEERFLRHSKVQLSELLHRTSPRWRRRFSRHLAQRNRGRVPFELPSPARTYFQLLAELSAIEGLTELRDVDRYTLLVRHGCLFAQPLLGRAVAAVFSRLLYPEESLEFAGALADAAEKRPADAAKRRNPSL